ncbi:VHP domain-containing protein [Naegleria gruberi]|uniref:VHP domain-containing protein n=1 Tax=Naegleria gruberi TaxID=5762 RepID=D2UX25_NAEGR|nr:VHP domain-containing protein [Naegleria gruberi]EFC50548.1 VHP domain-containing protein [Naegleria gruberi]|eukprot:XP_002683292.1 VHP domain-containing protein [Naegleria gruberi strain NEG-M]
MSVLSTTSKSSHQTRRTSGRVQQRIEQLENNVTIDINNTIQSKPIPITRPISTTSTSHSRLKQSTITSSVNTPTSTSSLPRRSRTKSKMEIFEDVYEQLEQLDELYFENMSIDDCTISSSPVIQFDNSSSESAVIPNLHVRMNSLMSRQEYETKRELICQQYYNADSDNDDFVDSKVDNISEHISIEKQLNQYLDPNLHKFSYLELKNKFPKGVKESEKEKYLSDDEFFTIFGMTQTQFQSLGEYKRRRLKIDKGLF